MRITRTFLLILPLALALAPTVKSQSKSTMRTQGLLKIPLNSGWQFREKNKDVWYPATVPGSVHTDLLANKLIGDPFYRDNEQKQQWIGKTDWEYRTTFKVNQQTLDHKNLELVFEGLDTYTDVYLNEKLLIKTDNMFRTWRVNCAGTLKVGDNTLNIQFRSPINEILPVMAKMKYELPAGNDQGEKTSPHTRKAPYQFGWDWGPRFVTSGIWRPISLEAWNNARIADLQITQKQVTREQANLTASIDLVSTGESQAELILEDVGHKTVVGRKQIKLTQGTNQVGFDFVVKNPSLWWPNGLGAHPLYTFRARILIGGNLANERSVRTGLRSLEVRQLDDAWGRSFAFIINGVPVFAKGANWIPADSFPTRMTREKYRWLIKSAADANMNMLRVWGGGIYETDEFYEMCDEMGILLWQEFMFACSMYPGNQEFLDNVRAEAQDNVRRLRNHPSIAIWSGNNEIETAWFNWGWKKSLPSSVWDDYQKIFDGVLKEVCGTLDPSRLYWPSSPHGGLPDDLNSEKSGDTHSWKVWHAAAPFTDYQKEFPRFMSEYGFQSFPQIETVETYTLPSEHDIQSPVMMAHQRHPRGNQLIKEYMLRDYPAPKDFESFLYLSQVLQAEGIKIGAEHLRRIMPRNMGSLYWQLDDCWPVASWSSIDYYGRWKALQYYAKRFYSPVLLSPTSEEKQLRFYVVSDLITETKAVLNVELRDLDGNKLSNARKDVVIAPLQSRPYLSVPVSQFLLNRDSKNLMIYCELLSADGRVLSSNEYFFEPAKSLALPTPKVSVEAVKASNGYKVMLTSDKLAKAVYLSAGTDGFFSDNYFDLLPDKPVQIEFRTKVNVPLEEFRKQLKVRSLKDAFPAT
ncbi:MAG TPA: glycoside hydrolase family 2 protein, partial [Pyrinomonadaceae bacterium]